MQSVFSTAPDDSVIYNLAFDQYWANPGSRYTATYLPSLKLSKLDEHAAHCWRNKGELISDFLQWTPSHGRAGVGRSSVGKSASTYLQQLCTDTGCTQENLRMSWTIDSQGNTCLRHDKIYIYIYIYIFVCVCVCVCVCVFENVYGWKKKQGLLRMILFVEIFANVYRFG